MPELIVPVGQLGASLPRTPADADQQVLRLSAGFHSISSTILLRPGTSLIGNSSGSTTISGGLRVAPWRRGVNGTYWTAPLPRNGSPRQLWVGELRATPARLPSDGNGFLHWRSALPEPFSRWGLVYEGGQGLERLRAQELLQRRLEQRLEQGEVLARRPQEKDLAK